MASVTTKHMEKFREICTDIASAGIKVYHIQTMVAEVLLKEGWKDPRAWLYNAMRHRTFSWIEVSTTSVEEFEIHHDPEDDWDFRNAKEPGHALNFLAGHKTSRRHQQWVVECFDFDKLKEKRGCRFVGRFYWNDNIGNAAERDYARIRLVDESSLNGKSRYLHHSIIADKKNIQKNLENGHSSAYIWALVKWEDLELTTQAIVQNADYIGYHGCHIDEVILDDPIKESSCPSCVSILEGFDWEDWTLE
jgi:hypothetical protein